MPRNYEIKAKLKDVLPAVRLAESFTSRYKNKSHFTENQKDIYYKTRYGRLKLRIINGGAGQLIFYSRKEKRSRRVSEYIICRTDYPTELERILKKMFTVMVTVVKKREIFTAGNTRIHIDSVKNLGNYLEFEIIFNSFKSATIKMKQLTEHFGLKRKDLIKCSYSNLLLKQKKTI